MNLKNTIIFLLVVIIVGFVSYTAIFGLDLGKYEVVSAKEGVDLGLDLAGGVFVVLEAETDSTGDELDKKMDQAMTIIRQRVDGLGVAEPNIVREGSNRIRIELAGLKNAQQAIDMIGKTAVLQFIDPTGKVVVTGTNIKNSEVQYQKTSGSSAEELVVALEFDKEGTEKFAEATGNLATKPNRQDRIIYIVLDEDVISEPAVGLHESIHE